MKNKFSVSKRTNNKCLFVYTSNAPFVRNDGQFLKKYFDVREYYFNLEKSPVKLIKNLFLFAFYVFFSIPKINFVYTWFTDYHSPIVILWAILFKKPIYTVVGGYEVEYIPNLKYGGLKNFIRKNLIIFCLNHATKLLVVSAYTLRKTRNLIKHERIELVYNGIDLTNINYKDIKNGKDKKYFLTVGNFKSEQILKLKGIDKFLQLAEILKEETFVIIGVPTSLHHCIRKKNTNVIIKPHMPFKELKEYYLKSKYYLQLSETESFGMSVLEALSFGVVPILSNRGALPEIFSKCSILIDMDNFDAELKIIPNKIEKYKIEKNTLIKFLSKFDINNRYDKLLKLLIN